jgi:hypothetical protein
MKQLNYLILIIFSISLIACNHQTSYTVTTLKVKPDSLYNEEATLFLSKPIIVEELDKAVKLQIGDNAPLFLQLRGRNNNYEKTNNPLDFYINYSTRTNGVYYELALLKTKDGSPFLTLALHQKNKHPTDTIHYITSGSGVGGALMESERNQVNIKITANAQ